MNHTDDAAANPLDVIFVELEGEVVAVCSPDRVMLHQSVRELPVDHPNAEMVDAKCQVALAILRGDLAGPYRDEDAELLAGVLLQQQAREEQEALAAAEREAYGDLPDLEPERVGRGGDPRFGARARGTVTGPPPDGAAHPGATLHRIGPNGREP
ncbi:hypothetical protein [Patulibacter sp. SYSU D01012]|uniref:hypothetical protein n=1 Tax=Patulibacter sp. SYSU D01012 TaxID=2817381 RepID=UPI001B316BE4|nr:hypothetical protein [Patulibacter sp. SYSU D01012]